jgi:hypothetical protein
MQVVPLAKLSRMATPIRHPIPPVSQRKEVSTYAKLCAIIDSAAPKYKCKSVEAHE